MNAHQPHQPSRRQQARARRPGGRVTAAKLKKTLIAGALVASGLAGLTSAGGQTPAFAAATTTRIPAPPGSVDFGSRVFVLKNGNFVVVDASSNIKAPSAGAVFLYNGSTHALISTLTGATAMDKIGSDGIVELDNSNFVVLSSAWHNGALSHVGAVTFVDGQVGLSGTVNPANSLVGSQANDAVGDTSVNPDAVVALPNGNYVVTASYWANAGLPQVGAVVWGNGATGVAGPIGIGNSLHGAHAFDIVGEEGTEALTNGDYVVSSPSWANGALAGAGAVTWGDGSAGTTGPVTTGNSLYGDQANDQVGSSGATPLTNGNYVVNSDVWRSGAVAEGAATWLSGAGPSSTTPSLVNSIHGSVADDFQLSTIVALTNGNYVVDTPALTATDIGAVTWGNGATGSSGAINMSTSILGSTANDEVGGGGVTPLSNGNFVISSPAWYSPQMFGGAATWASGTAGITGVVSATNSLIGSNMNDEVSSNGITALTNGNYVVNSNFWNGGRGAATWGNGASGVVGPVSATNSLIGNGIFDQVASHGSLALKNGNFVVLSPSWANGGAPSAGAATWGNGTTGIVGPLTTANSLVGSSPNDSVGYEGIALDDGNYVTSTQLWSNGAVAQVGEATWGNGTTGIVGPVTPANSLVGVTATDHVSDNGLVALPGGHYAVQSVSFNSGGIVTGAESFGGPGGVVGPVDASKGIVGTTLNQGGYVEPRFTSDGSAVIGESTISDVALYKDDSFTADYIPLPPARLADTRPGHTTVDGLFAAGGLRAAGSTLELPVAGRGGVPADAVAVTLNVTATEASGDGFVTVYPCGEPQPTASNLNVKNGGTIPNAVVTKLGVGGANAGKVCIFTQQALQLVVDVNGAFPPTTSYKAINPARLLDTRTGHTTIDGQQQATGAVGAGSVTTLKVTGRAGVPADATAVVLNVTVTEPTSAGYATVYPCGSEPPTASNLNYTAGLSIPNLVIAKIGTGGSVCIFSQSPTQLVADVLGYFPGATSFRALVPARLLDTRPGFTTTDGLSAGAGVQPTGTVTKVHVAGRGGVPAGATTAVLNVTVTDPAAPGFVTVYPCGIDAPLASNLNFAAGQTIPNAVLAKIGTGGDVCIFNSQPTQLIADVTGYFG